METIQIKPIMLVSLLTWLGFLQPTLAGIPSNGDVELNDVRSGFYLKVDLAYDRDHFPNDPDKEERYLKTAKPGWMIWEQNHWADLWTHDPRTFSESGINITLGYGYEGNNTMQILGMTPVGDGEVADGLPEGDPIANSYVFNGKTTTWGNDPNTSRPYWGSLFLRLDGEGLAPSPYTLTSYHNDANNPATRISYPTRVPPPYDFIESIKVVIDEADNCRWLPLSGPGVIQRHDWETVDINVPIQHVTSDAELVPSVIKFYYDGLGGVTIHYKASIGGCAVLNAFILRRGEFEPPGPATKPRPGNGAVNVHPDVVLKWQPGRFTVSHDVYFGTNWDDVNDGTGGTFMGNQERNSYDAGRLALATTYYWRIDEVNDANDDSPWKGPVWRFTTLDGKATNPSPINGETDVPLEVVLSWSPGTFAEGHDVYFGSDFDDVKDANTSSPEYKGRQDVNDSNYAVPGLLELDTTYCWRIDEVNSIYGDSKGTIWSFTTLQYLVVDDMESYDESTIRQTWKGGRDWPHVDFTGAEVSVGVAPVDPVHGGQQSMIYKYDNGDFHGYGLAYFSEIERTFDTPQDWTFLGVKVLMLYFYGDPGNDAGPTEQMYLVLEDDAGHIGVVSYDGDMNDIKKQEWQEWNIDLQDPCLVAAEVNVASIKKVYIGFGIRGNPNPGGTPGGKGTVCFDDIRLCLPVYPACWDYPAQCHGDSDDSGDVKGSDFLALKASWFKCYGNDGYDPCADFDRDGCVKGSDFLILKSNWYQTVEPNCPPGGSWPPEP